PGAALLAEERGGSAILLPQPAGKIPERAWRPAADHSARGSGQQRGLLSDLGWAFYIGPRGEPVLRQLQGRRRPMRGSEQLSWAWPSRQAGASPRRWRYALSSPALRVRP